MEMFRELLQVRWGDFLEHGKIPDPFAYNLFCLRALRRKGIIKAAFSYTGMDIFAATARESKALGDAESMKMAARKITLRVITLYCFAIITGSLVVPYNHPFLNGQAQSVGASSIFVIAVVEGGLPRLAHFFNAIFILSAFSCAANFLFLSSRVLYTLALLGQTGPEWITRRLQQCHGGVPTGAVIFSAFMTLLGYMGRTGSPGEVSRFNVISLPREGLTSRIEA